LGVDYEELVGRSTPRNPPPWLLASVMDLRALRQGRAKETAEACRAIVDAHDHVLSLREPPDQCSSETETLRPVDGWSTLLGPEEDQLPCLFGAGENLPADTYPSDG
jgi:hypothetical protein